MTRGARSSNMDPSKLSSPKTKSEDSKKPLKPPQVKRSHMPAKDLSGSSGQRVQNRLKLPVDVQVIVPDQKDLASQKVRFGALNAQQLPKLQPSELILQKPPGRNSHDNVHAQRIAQNANQSFSNGIYDDRSRHNTSKFGAFKSITDQIFHSNRNENRKVKAAVGVLAGLVIGGLLFVALVYSFGYTKLEAAIIASVATLIMSICLALSSFCRCVMALVFPNFFTGKGRAVFLSVIFGILLSNQISNITHNAKETGNSLACITELAVNQTRALQKQLGQPLNEITKYIKKQHEYFSNFGFGLRETFQKINEIVEKIHKGVDDATAALRKVAQDCRHELGKVCSVCKDVTFGFINDQCDDACDEITEVCSPLDHFNDFFADYTDIGRLGLNKFLRYFEVELDVDSGSSGSTRISKDLPDIIEEVNRDIEAKAKAVQFFLAVCNKVLSLSLLLIFFQAFSYLRNYLRKDSYDNVYITTQFRQMDREVVEQGGESILPLRKKERNLYVNTSAWKLNSTELAECKLGVLQVLLHFLLCLLVIFFDYALYYILSLIQKYDDIELDVKGQGRFRVNVKGDGPIADFYRKMVQDSSIDHNFTLNQDIGKCLPQPLTPSYDTLPVLLGLYIIALCFVFLRGYGMRMRRKISAYYYPEQEYDRMKYLHKQIRQKRYGFLKLKSSHKKDRLSFTAWVRSRCPCLSASRGKLECFRCEKAENSAHEVHIKKCSGVKGDVPCDAMYCQDCLPALGNGCPRCSEDDTELRY